VPYLYLIRHPHTQPEPESPSSQWRLSDAGRAQVQALVNAPFWDGVTAVYTSLQHKTTVVGQAVQAVHGITYIPLAGLDEAHRDRWLDAEAFELAQRGLFANPAFPPVPDWEAADAAGMRFAAAVQGVLDRHAPGESLAVVAHATVLTLYVARLLNQPPSYDLWLSIGFAVVIAVDRVTLRPVTPFITAPYTDLPLPGESRG
jgi:broad specificity phosphatase PhoE